MKKLIIFILCMLVFVGMGLSWSPTSNIDGRDYYTIYNFTNITSDSFIGNISGNANSSTYWDDETSQANLNVNSSNYWAGVSGFTTRWFYDSSNIFTFNETLLNSSIDNKIDVYNQSLGIIYVTLTQFENNNNSVVDYINAQDVIYNASMVTYSDNSNNSMKDYVDAEIASVNGTLNDTYVTHVEQLSNNDTLIAYIDSQDVIYNSSMVTYSDNSNDSMKSYVDAEIISLNSTLNDTYITYLEQLTNNVTLITYIDSQDTIYNSSMVTYVDNRFTLNNDTLIAYIDSQDTIYNSSMVTYVDAEILSTNNTLNDTYVTYLEQLTNNVTLIEYIDAQNTIYNSSMVDYVDAQNIIYNTSMKTYVDAEILNTNNTLNDTYITYLELLINNNSIVAYINAQDTIYNSSMVTYVNAEILSNNDTLKAYTNAQILDNNASMIAYVDAASGSDVNKSYVDSQDGVYNASMVTYVNAQILDNNASVVDYVNAQILDNNASVVDYVDAEISGNNVTLSGIGDCGIGNVVQNLTNGAPQCVAQSAGGADYDQDLNTTDDVTFNTVASTQNITIGAGYCVVFIDAGSLCGGS